MGQMSQRLLNNLFNTIVLKIVFHRGAEQLQSGVSLPAQHQTIARYQVTDNLERVNGSNVTVALPYAMVMFNNSS